jgi:hypothetical protein
MSGAAIGLLLCALACAIAKYLLTPRQFDANQIAYTWDLEDGCGGA